MVDLIRYAYSFSHGNVRANGKQFTGVGAVSINQSLDEQAVYGTEIKPIKRTVGQIKLGVGKLMFPDYDDGAEFFAHLSPSPLLTIWHLDYSLEREDGSVRSVSCISCRLTGFGLDHKAGPEAVGIEFPFSFMDVVFDGIPSALSPKTLARLALRGGQLAANQLL